MRENAKRVSVNNDFQSPVQPTGPERVRVRRKRIAWQTKLRRHKVIVSPVSGSSGSSGSSGCSLHARVFTGAALILVGTQQQQQEQGNIIHLPL